MTNERLANTFEVARAWLRQQPVPERVRPTEFETVASRALLTLLASWRDGCPIESPVAWTRAVLEREFGELRSRAREQSCDDTKAAAEQDSGSEIPSDGFLREWIGQNQALVERVLSRVELGVLAEIAGGPATSEVASCLGTPEFRTVFDRLARKLGASLPLPSSVSLSLSLSLSFSPEKLQEILLAAVPKAAELLRDADPHDLEDAMQQTCFEIVAGKVLPPARPDQGVYYLIGVLRNKLADLARLRQRYASCEPQILDHLSARIPPDVGATASQAAILRLEAKLDVFEASLPRRQRQVVHFRRGGFSWREIADLLGITAREVRQARRGLARKRRKFSEEFFGDSGESYPCETSEGA